MSKKLFIRSSLIALLLILPIISVFALADQTPAGATQSDSEVTVEQISDTEIDDQDNSEQTNESEGKSAWKSIKETFILLVLLVLIVGGPLFMIGHMIYVLIDTRKLKSPTLVAAFVSVRQKKGMSEHATGDENEQCAQLLDAAWETYSHIETDEDGKELRSPNKMREVLKARKLVKQAAKFMPTDEATVDRYNEHKTFLYDNLKRSFFSSWKLIILCLIIAVLAGFAGDTWFKGFITFGAFFWVPCIVYYLSGNVPQYMIDRKASRGGGGGWFVAALVGLGIGVLGSGQTVRTRYTDGTYEDDNSSHWIALVLGIFILVIVAMTIYVWSVINYLRNYVLYV